MENLKSTYQELKQTVERVRDCKYNENGAMASASFNGDDEYDSKRASEDFVKLDQLIEQLAERWATATNQYTQRFGCFFIKEFNYFYLRKSR